MAYTKQRANWLDYPTTSTPILASNLNAFEQTMFELKRGNVLYASDYGAATAASAATNTTAINSAIADASAAGGGSVFLGPGTYSITTQTFSGFSNVRLLGTGHGTTLSTATTTGNIFDFTNASFCSIESMQILSTAQRTAGALFFLDQGAGSCQRNEFRLLRILGGWRAFNLSNCTTTVIDGVQVGDFNATHSWDSVLSLTGTATSIKVSNMTGGTAAGMANGFIYISGAGVDTVMFHNMDILNLSPSTGMLGVNISAGEWIYFTDVSFECGTTADCMVVNGGKGISVTSCHFIGQRGVLLNAGTSFRMFGGEVLKCQQHGMLIGGGSHHEIVGVTISDCSQQTNATYDGINIGPGISDFTLRDNHFGKMLLGNANSMATAITVQAGASDRYVIQGNRIATTGVGTPMVDAGTGTDKVVSDNVWAGSGFPSVASATTVTLPTNAGFVNVTGTTTITSVTASYKGRRVTLNFAGILTFTDGLNLKLAGNFVTTADDTISLVCDGTNWIETSRSVN